MVTLLQLSGRLNNSTEKCTGECLDRSPLYPFRNSYRSVLRNPGNAQGNHPKPLVIYAKRDTSHSAFGRTLGATRLDHFVNMIPPRFSQLFFCKTRRVLAKPPPCHGVAWRLWKELRLHESGFRGNPCNPGFKQGEVILHFAELASDLLLWPSEFGMILHNFANV